MAFLLVALIGYSSPPALTVETNVLVRDPSTIVKRDGTYWVYGTGLGTQQFSSKDKIHWTKQGPALPQPPDWLVTTVPENKNEVWAPDIHFFGGKYHLYSSYSQWGTINSGIGVATNSTLDPKGWVSQGLVVSSKNGEDVNAIDPCVFQDAAGNPWLSYGSYSTGICLMQLDPNTGKQQGTEIYKLATHPAGPGAAIEASYIYYHDGYYYLFVNWDACCAAARSSYNIRVGRSKTVTGPYLDKTGKDMIQGGGTLFLAATFDNGSGRPIDEEVGPGHVGILQDTDGYWLSTHYEWARDKDGATTMNLNQLSWDSDGWPRVVLDAGPYKLTSWISTHGVASVVSQLQPQNSALKTLRDQGQKSQLWTLTYQGEGYYGLINTTSRRALSVKGDGKNPGLPIEMKPFSKADTQLWYVQANDDGTYTLLSKASNKADALDVANCSLNDGTPIQTWTSNGLECQKWSFRLR